MKPPTRPRSAVKEISLLWQNWWRKQTPSRQDRFAFLGPLTAVIMFFAAISSAFWYLRYEEMERERAHGDTFRADVQIEVHARTSLGNPVAAGGIFVVVSEGVIT